MRLNGLRVELIIAAFTLVAVVVFGVQWAVDRYSVQRPLLAAAARVEGVRQAVLSEENGRINLVVTLGPGADFREAYERLSSLLDKAFGKAGGRIVVKDSRTPRLAKALYEMNFALQEGLATGRYGAMRAAVESTAQRLQLSEPYLWVDDGRVYLGLREGRAALFALVERSAPHSETAPAEGAGGIG